MGLLACYHIGGGLVNQVAQRGEPSIFIAHGTRGEVLPIDVSSGRRVARLERDGYEVRYRKFDGGHAVLPRSRTRQWTGSSPSEAERITARRAASSSTPQGHSWRQRHHDGRAARRSSTGQKIGEDRRYGGA